MREFIFFSRSSWGINDVFTKLVIKLSLSEFKSGNVDCIDDEKSVKLTMPPLDISNTTLRDPVKLIPPNPFMGSGAGYASSIVVSNVNL